MKSLIAASILLASLPLSAKDTDRVASSMEADVITSIIAKTEVAECPEYTIAEVVYSARDALVLPVIDRGRSAIVVQFTGIGSDGESTIIRTMIDLEPTTVVKTLSVYPSGKVKEDLSDANDLIIPSLCTSAAAISFR